MKGLEMQRPYKVTVWLAGKREYNITANTPEEACMIGEQLVEEESQEMFDIEVQDSEAIPVEEEVN